MSTIPSRIAAIAAPVLLLMASVAVRADPQTPAAPEAAVERAFDQLPEEASTAFGDLCRQKSAKKSAPNDFMPDCTSLLARRLDEAAKAPKPAVAVEAPRAAASPAEPKAAPAPEKLDRLADLPPAKAAGHVPVEAVAVLGPAPAKDAEPPAAEVTAVEVKSSKTPSAATREARKPAARKPGSRTRSVRAGADQAAAASRPPAEARAGQPAPQARGASTRKDPWTELRAAPPDAARSAPAQAAQPAAEEPKKGLSLSEFAARLMGAKPKPAEPQAQPAAAPAAQAPR